MTDETVHMPPGVPGRPAGVRLPNAPEVVPQVEVELVGGPAHGRTIKVREDRQRIEVPYTVDTETVPEESDVELELGKDAAPERKVAEVSAFTLVYLRPTADALTANFSDIEVDA